MTTKTDSNQNTEKDADDGVIERPAPRRPAFLVNASTPTPTTLAIGNLENKRRVKRGW